MNGTDFDRNKFDEMVLYTIWQVDDPSRLGAVKLNKALLRADLDHFQTEGRSIAGARYVRAPNGPICEPLEGSIARLKAAGRLAERHVHHHGYRQRQFIGIKPANIRAFTPTEIDRIGQAVRFVRKHTARTISAMTHDIAWDITPDGEEIPLSAYWASLGPEDERDLRGWAANAVTDEDMEWAARELARAL